MSQLPGVFCYERSAYSGKDEMEVSWGSLFRRSLLAVQLERRHSLPHFVRPFPLKLCPMCHGVRCPYEENSQVFSKPRT